MPRLKQKTKNSKKLQEGFCVCLTHITKQTSCHHVTPRDGFRLYETKCTIADFLQDRPGTMTHLPSTCKLHLNKTCSSHSQGLLNGVRPGLSIRDGIPPSRSDLCFRHLTCTCVRSSPFIMLLPVSLTRTCDPSPAPSTVPLRRRELDNH